MRRQLVAALPDQPDLREGRRWTRPEGWHLTLAFLGTVEDARVLEVTAALEAAVAAQREADHGPPPDTLRCRGVGRFGRRVLWVGIEDEPPGSLAALAGSIRERLTATGLRIDPKPLRAHLTLARAGRRPISSELVEACQSLPTPSWRPAKVELWRSELGRGPARYRTEATVPL